MQISGHTALYAVIGRPVRHSRSPALHNAWLRAAGIDAVYLALDVAPEDGPQLMDAVRTLGLAGANLTVPHKQVVVPHLDAIDDDVRAIGAANTIVRSERGYTGHNTDAQGFVRSFEAEHGATLAGRRVLLLGAGGASVAVAKGLLDAGVDRIDVVNRTVARASALADRLSPTIHAHPLERAAELGRGADLVVNALAGEGIPAAHAVDPELLAANAVWCDLNYWMDAPPGLLRCRQANVPFLDGHGMLYHQAALAFAHLTGMSPPDVTPAGQVE